MKLKDGELESVDVDEKKLIFPKEMKKISLAAMEMLFICKNIKEISVEEGNQKYKSVNNCLIDREEKKIIISSKGSVIPKCEEVRIIGKGSFCINENESVEIPDNIEKIGDLAFKDSKIKNIFIPCSVNEIGMAALNTQNFCKTLKVDLKNERYRSENNCILEGNRVIAVSKNAEIPEGAEEIAELTFMAECDKKNIITIPESVVKIEKSKLNMPSFIEFPIVIKAKKGSYAISFAKENGIEILEI